MTYTFQQIIKIANRDILEALKQKDEAYALSIVEWVAREALKLGKESK